MDGDSHLYHCSEDGDSEKGNEEGKVVLNTIYTFVQSPGVLLFPIVSTTNRVYNAKVKDHLTSFCFVSSLK